MHGKRQKTCLRTVDEAKTENGRCSVWRVKNKAKENKLLKVKNIYIYFEAVTKLLGIRQTYI